MRVRLRFTKHGKVRFTSHRDVARMWERALRLARLPIATSQGFSPRPKVHFGLALSTSHESEGEYLDVDLRDPESATVDVDGLPALLSPLLPPGVEVTAVTVVPPGTMSLQEAVVACAWRIEVPDVTVEDLRRRVEAALAAPSLTLTRVRKGKEVTDDLRPAIEHLDVLGPTPADAPEAGAVLLAHLRTQPRGMRPAELLAVLDPPCREGRVRRTHQWIERDGARREPLPADATDAPHAEVRAS